MGCYGGVTDMGGIWEGVFGGMGWFLEYREGIWGIVVSVGIGGKNTGKA